MKIRDVTKEQYKKLNELSLSVSEDEHIEHINLLHCKKYGQLKTPIICVVDGKVRVVDGYKYMDLLFKHYNVIRVNYIGEMSLDEFIALRLFLNVSNNRAHFINIAKYVESTVKKSIDRERLLNKTNLTLKEIERYETLLSFDWDEFKKLAENTEQPKLF